MKHVETIWEIWGTEAYQNHGSATQTYLICPGSLDSFLDLRVFGVPQRIGFTMVWPKDQFTTSCRLMSSSSWPRS